MESARVYGILAPEANKVVLFRRGPSKLTLQLVWDLETDEITPGQWIRGKVYVERCDVSPDGRYFVAAIANYGKIRQHERQLEYWTAISRPPYFTALAIWGSYGSYEGGGFWRSNNEVSLNNLVSTFDNVEAWVEVKGVQPPVTAINLNPSSNSLRSLQEILHEKRGWIRGENFSRLEVGERLWEAYAAMTLTTEPKLIDKAATYRSFFDRSTFTREVPGGKIWLGLLGDTFLWQFYDERGSLITQWTTSGNQGFWLEVDHNGWPIFSDKGCLYRWTNFPNGEPTLVADLNHYTFEPVAPPAWATKW